MFVLCIIFNVLYITASISDYYTSYDRSIDFTDCPDTSTAFILLTTKLFQLLKTTDFCDLKRAVLAHGNTPCGAKFTDDVQTKIIHSKNLDDLLDTLSTSDNWNWIDLRLVDALAFASNIREACRLVEKYRDFTHSIKLSKILEKLAPHQEKYKDKYITKVGEMIEKEPYQITVRDLEKYYPTLKVVIMDIISGSCVLEHLPQ